MTELKSIQGSRGSYTLPEEGLFCAGRSIRGSGKKAYTQAFFPDKPHVTVTPNL